MNEEFSLNTSLFYARPCNEHVEHALVLVLIQIITTSQKTITFTKYSGLFLEMESRVSDTKIMIGIQNSPQQVEV